MFMLILINISLSFLVLLILSTKSWIIEAKSEIVTTTTATTTSTATTTALDDYVWKHDDNYHWVEMPQYGFNGTSAGRNYTAYMLNMTSQRWLTDDDFSIDSDAKSIWWHYLVVFVPDKLRFHRNATLWITGGGVKDGPPQPSDEDIVICAAMASSSHIITAALFQIPNEHVIFKSDPIQKSRTEDSIIAYTWQHFLDDPSQPQWLLRFPMVKASVRAMDAVSEFVSTKLKRLHCKLDYFIVSGASKRGWTAWDVGAVDSKRVMAIIPVVLDAINFVEVEHHQFRSYGGWSFALSDYTDLNLTSRFDDPNMLLLQQNVDPFFYKERLTMPKVIINAFLDEFQQPDDTHYWWSEMPEPKHFMMIPNAEHSLATGIFEAVPAMGNWIHALVNNDDIPSFKWTISDENGEIVVTLPDDGSEIHEANVWYGYSCGVNAFDGGKFRRDFRVAHLDYPCTCGFYAQGTCVNLKSFNDKQPLEMKMVNGLRTFSAHFDAPEDGRWVAYFIDIKFKSKRILNDDDLADQQAFYNELSKLTASKKLVKGIFPVEEIFPNFGGIPHDLAGYFQFTTEVSVWPNTFPYEECNGQSCGVRLL